MHRSILMAASVAALATLGHGSAQAQAIGVDIYLGPPAAYYEPSPYAYETPVYGYYGYAPGVTVYPQRRLRCEGSYRYWNGNHCVDALTEGSSQQ